MAVYLLMRPESPTITSDIPPGHECQGLLIDFTPPTALLLGPLAMPIGAISALVPKTQLLATHLLQRLGGGPTTFH